MTQREYDVAVCIHKDRLKCRYGYWDLRCEQPSVRALISLLKRLKVRVDR